MKLGIVGLPNVGKSTLFNALTNAGAESANYPFCTIEPNVGVVTVPDTRKIHTLKAHIHGDGNHLKGIWVKAAHFGKRTKEREGILAARNANGNAVARLDHIIVLARAAHVAQHSANVHYRSPPSKKARAAS